MSFKKNLIVIGILLVFSIVATVLALPWATPDLVLSSFGFFIEYPVALLLLGGIVVAGLVGDRLQ